MKKKKQGKKSRMVWGATGTIGNVCPKTPGNFGTSKGKK